MAVKPSASENLLLEAFDRRRKVARHLHDEIGPLLSAAGFKLTLLKMDHPAAAALAEETQGLLEDAMQRMRALSQDLGVTAAEQVGLARALEGLAVRSGAPFRYDSDVRVPVDAAIALYAIAEWALDAAERARLSVTGRRIVRLEVHRPNHPGRMPPLIHALFRRAGVRVDIRTKRSTIVTARYAV